LARTIAKDHDEKRSQILKTAARVFSEQGFARASMSHVASSCGISKANIYHYYDSKDALLFDILDTYLSALRHRLLSLPLSGLPPEKALHKIASETLLAYEGMDHEHKIQLEAIPMLEPEKQEILKGYQREIVSQLSEILYQIAPDAFGDDKRKLRSAVMSVFGMLNWFYIWNPNADQSAREEYADLVTRLTLHGLAGL
jgi:AcrR family transcriptional regulator